jgi:hypothetical protein
MVLRKLEGAALAGSCAGYRDLVWLALLGVHVCVRVCVDAVRVVRATQSGTGKKIFMVVSQPEPLSFNCAWHRPNPSLGSRHRPRPPPRAPAPLRACSNLGPGCVAHPSWEGRGQLTHGSQDPRPFSKMMRVPTWHVSHVPPWRTVCVHPPPRTPPVVTLWCCGRRAAHQGGGGADRGWAHRRGCVRWSYRPKRARDHEGAPHSSGVTHTHTPTLCMHLLLVV